MTPTEALKQLMRGGRSADAAAEAAEVLTLAMRGPACRLWCNGNLVPIKIKLTLAVEAHYVAEPKDKAGWIATIEITAGLGWEHPPDYYHWEFAEAEVLALLPSADDRPRRKGSRVQRKIRREAEKEWPNGGWKDIPTHRIMKKLKIVTSRTTYARALGRRPD